MNENIHLLVKEITLGFALKHYCDSPIFKYLENNVSYIVRRS